MFGLGFGELLVILLIALIFIGPKKLPELAKGLGQGLREFQKATKGFTEQLDQAKKEITDASQTVDHTPPVLAETETHNDENHPDPIKPA
ncbi:MAG: twin-arginine translocase TatA/TatE family subunit [Bacteriovoracaceae bacterium]|nr:twin-arginine translocase TatA/TatE family subunit [Bacteriovoracaceae bacterium]